MAESTAQAGTLADMLVRRGVVSAEALDAAVAASEDPHARVEHLLVKSGQVSGADMALALAAYLDMSPIALAHFTPASDVLESVPNQWLNHIQAVPVNRVGDRLFVALADPFNINGIDMLHTLTGLEIVPLVAVEKEVADLLERHTKQPAQNLEDILKDVTDGEVEVGQDEDDDINIDEMKEIAEEAPVIRMVNSILVEALRTPRERYPHRAHGKGHAPALPHRRRALREPEPAQAAPARHHLPHQDHGQPGHRRTARAAGRAFQDPGDGQRGGRAREHPADGARREDRHAHPGQDHPRPQPRRARPGPGGAREVQLRDPAAARHAPGDGSHRQREDHHALLLPAGPEPARREHHHGRGPRGVPAGRDQPGPDPGGGRADLRGGAALDPAAGPRHRHGGRDPGRRDRRRSRSRRR